MVIFKRTLLILSIIFLFVFKGYAQFSVSYYQSSFSKVGLEYSFSDWIWSELRLYGNTGFKDVTPELVVCLNIVHRDFHNIYVGVGGNMNVLTGFVMPVGIQFNPIQRYRRFSVHVEVQPTYDMNSEYGIIQSAWGIRYRFGRSD